MTDVEMVSIAAGELRVGTRRAPRILAVDEFEIARFPITEEQLSDVLGVLPDAGVSHPRRPAVQVSWLRAVRLCNALSEWEGLEPTYRVDGDRVRRFDGAEGFRLPTEVEWEYACRAGSAAPHYGPLADVAWTAADGVRAPQPVGGRLPNLFGLFDTLGNVWEWCEDLYDPERSDDARVLRGGGFADDQWGARADARRPGHARDAFGDAGLRVARG